MNKRVRNFLMQGEGEQLDYKQTISSARKIAKTMSAFANHKGGTLLIGIRDNRSVSGIRSEEEKHMLDVAASFFVKPEVKITVIEHLIDNKQVLECQIPEGDLKPYYAKTEDDKWMAYIRVKDRSLLASKVVVDVLKRQQANKGLSLIHI